MTCGEIQVRYISGFPSIEFEKGKTYIAHQCRNPKLLAFYDRHGDEYGYPASRFEVIDENALNEDS